MIDAGSEILAVASDRLQGVCERDVHFGAVLRAAIGEHSLGELPDTFVGVQLGSVAGEAQEVEARDAANEFLDQASGMGPASVPEEEHVAAQVA